MDDIVRLYVGSINTTESNIINSTNGVIIKSIFICNKTANKQTVNFNIDGKDFLFDIETKSTLIINDILVCNVLNAKILEAEVTTTIGDPTESETNETETPEINIFISGLRLGVA